MIKIYTKKEIEKQIDSVVKKKFLFLMNELERQRKMIYKLEEHNKIYHENRI